MKAIVLFDSIFGNTEQIARAVGASLGSPEEVTVLRVGGVQTSQLAGLETLVVGSPTRGFRPTPAVTDFLNALPSGTLQNTRVAAFDTRIATADIKPAIFRFIVNRGGYAAPLISKTLQEKGGVLVLPPEGFFVEESEGPLKPGELERAAAWAKQITAAR